MYWKFSPANKKLSKSWWEQWIIQRPHQWCEVCAEPRLHCTKSWGLRKSEHCITQVLIAGNSSSPVSSSANINALQHWVQMEPQPDPARARPSLASVVLHFRGEIWTGQLTVQKGTIPKWCYRAELFWGLGRVKHTPEGEPLLTHSIHKKTCYSQVQQKVGIIQDLQPACQALDRDSGALEEAAQ